MVSTAFGLGAVLATTFYHGWGDRGVVAPRQIERAPRIEMSRDIGPIIELTVACRPGFAIVSYSKIDRRYCGPRSGCGASLEQTVRGACRGR